MNDYTVTLVYDRFNVTTIVYADDEEQAKRLALTNLRDEGWSFDEPIEYQIEWEGSFNG